ncbi:uncharacterized protein N7483_008006 [Penicillium malachiteum]|uniref:uncharacterized protein n=1 Tax=Penicillium malachiteum TaxID=1324776 RepID=UPI002548BECF|nr:uncharacterized protein N7483_008006 [Penicillium malachiteum]KAJ5726649.1 hypothetical protein N7483_008006 [Penicillium malachiteum]
MAFQTAHHNTGLVVNQAHNVVIQEQNITYVLNDESISVNKSFFSGSHYERHKNVNPPRTKDTCRWFLNHLTFQEWRQRGRSDVLWVSADPGCGKSVLSRSLVDEGLTHNGSATTCYFFFESNEDQNQITTAICALLNQLFCRGRGEKLFRKFAIEAIEKDGGKLKDNFGLLWDLFISVASDSATGDVICILDALDECRQPDRNTLMLHLKQFHEKFADKWNES